MKKLLLPIIALSLSTFALGMVIGNWNGHYRSQIVLADLIQEENTGWELDGLKPMLYNEAVKEDTDRDIWNSGYYQALRAFEYNISR